MKSILYVSRSLIPASVAEGEVNSMVNSAQVRNASLSVTGALIYTGPRFAQLLEGPNSSVDQIMGSIERDPRHEQIVRIPVKQTGERRFSAWSMAYAGPSLYVDRQVKRHFTYSQGAHPSDEGANLIELMWALNHSQSTYCRATMG
jgi:hypothetical protein